jgi:NAD-dependent DNA ligase
MGAGEEELVAIPEIGPKIASSIISFFAEMQNAQVIDKLVKAGVNTGLKKKAPAAVPGRKGLCPDRALGALPARKPRKLWKGLEEKYHPASAAVPIMSWQGKNPVQSMKKH